MPYDNHDLIYWLTAGFIFLLSVVAAPHVYEYLRLSGARSKLFQILLEIAPRPLVPRYVKLVIIDDDEFWKGYPAGRRPIKRDYLARIIDKLTDAHAHVIAIDFDVRLPEPETDPPEVPREYKTETDRLIASIFKAAATQKVVLSRTIWANESGYRLEPDIYEPYGICVRSDQKACWENPGTKTSAVSAAITNNITCGYIALPYDPLLIPGRIKLFDGNAIDSFALAVTSAVNPRLTEKFLEDRGTRGTYGSFILTKRFSDYDSIMTSGLLLASSSDEAYRKFNGQVVIVGGGWSSLANRRGRAVDTHSTPIGEISGALLHANYVEAILDSRTFTATPLWLRRLAEVAVGLAAVLVFASAGNLLTLIAAVLLASMILVLLEWSALHHFGVFFDPLVPLLALWLHSVYDRLLA